MPYLTASTPYHTAKPNNSNDLRVDVLRVWDWGCKFLGEYARNSNSLNGSESAKGKRGVVDGFSRKSASRLRDFLVTQWGGPGAFPVGFTFTTRRGVSPAEWRRRTDALGKWFARREIPAVWRVELQRRGVPHLHLVAFVPPDWIAAQEPTENCTGQPAFWCRAYVLTRDAWLRICRADDRASVRYSVRISRIVDGSGWACYMAIHNSKRKHEQLGWKGRQWGVFHRAGFEPRPSKTLAIESRKWCDLMRRVRRWLRGRFDSARKNYAKPRSKPLRLAKERKLKPGTRLTVPDSVVSQLVRELDVTVRETDGNS